MRIAGLGPHGERAAPPECLAISADQAARARSHHFRVAVVLHTTASDWAKQQLAGILKTLEEYAAALVDVTDCRYSSKAQVETLRRLRRERPDAIVSLPVDNAAVAEAHRAVVKAGIKLVLLDNAPTGLLAGHDYACVVSNDNFGLGRIAAALLSPHVADGGMVGILAYGVDFFAANEREIGFREWMEATRPDLVLNQENFAETGEAGAATNRLLDAYPETKGLFVVWDEPAMLVVAAMRNRAIELPMTTVDLGNESALELADGTLIKGIGAQRPYDQGVAAAEATIHSLLGNEMPPWIALPGLSVQPDNVVEAYQVVWHLPAAPSLISARRGARARRSAICRDRN